MGTKAFEWGIFPFTQGDEEISHFLSIEDFYNIDLSTSFCWKAELRSAPTLVAFNRRSISLKLAPDVIGGWGGFELTVSLHPRRFFQTAALNPLGHPSIPGSDAPRDPRTRTSFSLWAGDCPLGARRPGAQAVRVEKDV